MSFGLTGAHGAGKTTLAKEVAEALSIPYHDAGTTRLMQAAGYNPVNIPGLDGRLDAQEMLLSAYLAEVRALPRPFITDRTPLDMAAYLLGEITMTNATEAQGKRAVAYVDRCVRETEKLFDSFVIVPPLPSYDAQPKRPPPNAAYQRKFHLLITGLVKDKEDDRNFVYGELVTTKREERLAATISFIQARIDKWMEIKGMCNIN